MQLYVQYLNKWFLKSLLTCFLGYWLHKHFVIVYQHYPEHWYSRWTDTIIVVFYDNIFQDNSGKYFLFGCHHNFSQIKAFFKKTLARTFCNMLCLNDPKKSRILALYSCAFLDAHPAVFRSSLGTGLQERHERREFGGTVQKAGGSFALTFVKTFNLCFITLKTSQESGNLSYDEWHNAIKDLTARVRWKNKNYFGKRFKALRKNRLPPSIIT